MVDHLYHNIVSLSKYIDAPDRNYILMEHISTGSASQAPGALPNGIEGPY